MKYFTMDLIKLPDIDEISTEIPAVSEYLDASMLPEGFSQSGWDTLPVINDKGVIVGIVSEFDLAKIIPEWSFTEDSYRCDVKVADIMTKDVWTVETHTNIESILGNISQMHTRVIPVVDKDNIYTGLCVTRTELINYLTRRIKPRTLGGLATPLGVYITDGKHQAGAKNSGLVLTGAVFGVMFYLIDVATRLFLTTPKMPAFVLIMIQFGLFLLALRLTPLVKIHAAEHQTINAIEKGLPLNPETVQMQPRTHRRCGTNIMVLILSIQLLLLIIYEVPFFSNPVLQFVFILSGFMFIFSSWKQAGMWLQQHFTTAKAGEKEIQSGIKAGLEILENYKIDTKPQAPKFYQKLWNMGLVQILLGFVVSMNILDLLIYSVIK